MRYILFFLLCINTLLASAQKEGFEYPILSRSDHFDIIYSTKVSDPYRFLEESRSDITKNWLRAQSLLSNRYFNQSILQNSIYKRIEQRSYYQLNLERKLGDYFFSFRFNYKNQAPSLYIRRYDQKYARLLINPSIFDEEDESISSIVDYSLSIDQKFLAISISKSGSEWKEIRILNIETKRLLKDHLRWIKLSNVIWNNSGLYYSRFNAPPLGEEKIALNQYSQIYYHQLNSEQAEDKLIYEQKNIPLGVFNLQLLDNSKLLIYGAEYINDRYVQKIYKKSLNDIFDSLYPIISDDYNSSFSFNILSENKNSYLVSTNRYTPNKNLFYISKDSNTSAKQLINNDYYIYNSFVIKDKILLHTHKNMKHQLFLYDSSGNELDRVYFSDANSINNISTNNNDSIVYFYLNSYSSTPRLCKYNTNNFNLEISKAPKLSYDEIKIITEIIHYNSKDGTSVPMTIIRRADMKFNADQPTMIYGYGGFGVPIEPFYDAGFIFFVQNGGVIAIPGIRGGGENGEEWHQAGRKSNKINAINDFAYAAKYLIKNRYTNPQKLVARGSSNGALIIAACINNYPELFKTAILEAGLYDMIRYHLFTTGYLASSEYGTSSDSKEFEYLLNYSPIHNIDNTKNYPSILLITGENDDRVPSLHSYKLAANLQSLRQKNNLVLLDVIQNAGHYGPQSYEEILKVDSKIYAFIFNELGIKIKLNN